MQATGIRTPTETLTAAFVKSVKKAGKYGDDNGLRLVVKASGAKQWVQRVTIRGKRTEMGLGSGRLVTLAEAREVLHHMPVFLLALDSVTHPL